MCDRISEILDRYLSKGGVGINLSFAFEGSNVYNYSAGLADRKKCIPIRQDHLFKIGSCTKTFVAAGLVKMAERGLLDLGTNIARWFPEIEPANGITVLQLLNHRSALPEFEHDIPMTPNRLWAPRDIVDLAFLRNASGRSGGAAVYNNTGYVLAGMIIEAISDVPLATYIRETLLKPIGLIDTWSAATEVFPQERISRGYYLRPQSTFAEGDLANGAEMWRMEGILPISDELQDSTEIFPLSAGFGCGDMISTTADMVAFMSALFGKQILSPQSLEIMQNHRVAVSFPGTRMREAGAGLFASYYADRLMLGHQGSIPGYVSVMQHDPKTRITIAMASNVGSGNRMSFQASGLHSVVDEVVAVLLEIPRAKLAQGF